MFVEFEDKYEDKDENADADQTRTGRPVGGQESTNEVEKGILFNHGDIKHSPWRSREVSCLITRTSSTQQERGDPQVDSNPHKLASR